MRSLVRWVTTSIVQAIFVSVLPIAPAPQKPLVQPTAPFAQIVAPSAQPTPAAPSPPPISGIGMTMPTDPPHEATSVWINTNLPTQVLPFGYNVAPVWAQDNTVAGVLGGNCSSKTQNACPASWHGVISEQDGRLNPFLRQIAQKRDAKYILLSAVWAYFALQPPPQTLTGKSCGAAAGAPTRFQCAAALAQLAVTGRQAFNSFRSWNMAYWPRASGPQPGDLTSLARAGYQDIPALMPATISDNDLVAAARAVLGAAYYALWEIRSNDPTWRTYRTYLNWIAVSGEDDTPHRPVNVPTSPYPQFDIAVPIQIGRATFTLTARYMIATQADRVPQWPNPTPPQRDMRCVSGVVLWTTERPTPNQPPPNCTPPLAPALEKALFNPCTKPQPPLRQACVSRLTLPTDDAATLMTTVNKNADGVLLYIHGGGSRLEEADPLADAMLLNFIALVRRIAIVSVDLPNSGYDDQALVTSNGARSPLNAIAFEGGSSVLGPTNVRNFPVLNFTLNFINDFIIALQSQGIIPAKNIYAIMGGSLGGNTTLLLEMHPLPAPFALTAPSAIPLNAISWSPTSMLAQGDVQSQLVINGNMCCIPGTTSTGWEDEGSGDSNTRRDYIKNVYFNSIVPATGLPADPEMWYRGSDWLDLRKDNFAVSYIAQSRFDRYEIYSALMRRWTTAIDTEQAVFSFQDEITSTNFPYFSAINGRVLLMAGACDDFDNDDNHQPPQTPPTMSRGACAGIGIGDTGAGFGLPNVLKPFTHLDIYGFTHDVANDMQNTWGSTLFLNDTGHSIHDERPRLLAAQALDFLVNTKQNVNITVYTADQDVRWNSEVHAIFGFSNAGQATTFDIPLNYWFHTYPAFSTSPDSPCTGCVSLVAFRMPSASINNTVDINEFTVTIPSQFDVTNMTSFSVKLISGTDFAIGNAQNTWDLAGIAACMQGASSSFVDDGFPSTAKTTTFVTFNSSTPWASPSFETPPGNYPRRCGNWLTNPPPTHGLDPPSFSFDGTYMPASFWQTQ